MQGLFAKPGLVHVVLGLKQAHFIFPAFGFERQVFVEQFKAFLFVAGLLELKVPEVLPGDEVFDLSFGCAEQGALLFDVLLADLFLQAYRVVENQVFFIIIERFFKIVELVINIGGRAVGICQHIDLVCFIGIPDGFIIVG